MPLTQMALDLLRLATVHLEDQLDPWLSRPVPLQMCLCDIWHDHLLFEGERLTGLIDFGSVKVDHVAVDLGRMVGSLVQDDSELRQKAFAFYSQIQPLEEMDIALADVLDRSGTILGLVNWLTWIYWHKRRFENHDAVARRMTEAIERVERWC